MENRTRKMTLSALIPMHFHVFPGNLPPTYGICCVFYTFANMPYMQFYILPFFLLILS